MKTKTVEIINPAEGNKVKYTRPCWHDDLDEALNVGYQLRWNGLRYMDAGVIDRITNSYVGYFLHQEKKYPLQKSNGRGRSGKQYWYIKGDRRLRFAARSEGEAISWGFEKLLKRLTQ